VNTVWIRCRYAIEQGLKQAPLNLYGYRCTDHYRRIYFRSYKDTIQLKENTKVRVPRRHGGCCYVTLHETNFDINTYSQYPFRYYAVHIWHANVNQCHEIYNGYRTWSLHIKKQCYQRRRILIVDDELDIAFTFKMVLE
jgi:hypothetical protein